MSVRDNISLLVPIGSAIIIFASAVKNFLFYSVYNIAILKYLTLTDFFILFILDGITLITTTVLLVMFYTAFEGKDRTENISIINHTGKTPIWLILTYSIIVMSGLQTLIVFGSKFTYGFIGISLLILFFINMAFIMYLKNKIADKFQEIFLISGMILSLILLMSALAFRDVYQFSSKPGKAKHIIILENETITTNKNLIYVGKTLDYIFLYNKKDDMARIIKSDKLKEMRIKVID